MPKQALLSHSQDSQSNNQAPSAIVSLVATSSTLRNCILSRTIKHQAHLKYICTFTSKQVLLQVEVLSSQEHPSA